MADLINTAIAARFAEAYTASFTTGYVSIFSGADSGGVTGFPASASGQPAILNVGINSRSVAELYAILYEDDVPVASVLVPAGTGVVSVDVSAWPAITSGSEYHLQFRTNGLGDVEFIIDDASSYSIYVESSSGSTYDAPPNPLESGAWEQFGEIYWSIETAASNSAPVVNDQTFSVADSASNGTVIGTLVATDSDGTVDSYAISGTTLAINSTTGQITLADNSGIVAGTPITATATVTDNDGDTDTATVTVNVTNSGLSFSCYDADSSNAAITSETLSHVRVLDPADLSEVATATSIATSSTGSAEIDTDSVTIGTDYLVIARRSNGDVCEPFSVTASDLAAS